MNTLSIVLLVLLIILIGVLIALYIFGRKAQKKQQEAQAQIEATKQVMSMLIIDKKRMPLKESGLPQMVIDQTPKMLRGQKVPIVKAKIGPRIQILIADDKIFDLIPLRKEIKAEVSGLYIVGVRGIHAPLQAPPQKKGWFAKLRGKAVDMVKKDAKEQAKSQGTKGKKNNSQTTAKKKKGA